MRANLKKEFTVIQGGQAHRRAQVDKAIEKEFALLQNTPCETWPTSISTKCYEKVMSFIKGDKNDNAK